jgi:uncharacterized protein (TIGR03086 family)
MDPNATEIADRYRRLAGAFSERIANVAEDAWDRATPCEEWTVRDLVGHVVQSQGMFRGFVGRETPEVSVEADPLAAWATVSSLVQEDLDDPVRASETFEGFFGVQRFDEAVDRFLCTDLIVHSWDLARATGQDDRMDPADIRRVAAVAEGFGDAMRGAQAFGPALDAPAGADEQDRLLAYLGRRSR